MTYNRTHHTFWSAFLEKYIFKCLFILCLDFVEFVLHIYIVYEKTFPRKMFGRASFTYNHRSKWFIRNETVKIYTTYITYTCIFVTTCIRKWALMKFWKTTVKKVCKIFVSNMFYHLNVFMYVLRDRHVLSCQIT